MIIIPHVYTENIALSYNFRAAPEFPNFVGIVIETLLGYANDKESDVRMVSDECLNRITKVITYYLYPHLMIALLHYVDIL